MRSSGHRSLRFRSLARRSQSATTFKRFMLTLHTLLRRTLCPPARNPAAFAPYPWRHDGVHPERAGRPPPPATNTVKRSTPTLACIPFTSRHSRQVHGSSILTGKAVTLRGSCGRPWRVGSDCRQLSVPSSLHFTVFDLPLLPQGYVGILGRKVMSRYGTGCSR
jgi:hypothetical protein